MALKIPEDIRYPLRVVAAYESLTQGELVATILDEWLVNWEASHPGVLEQAWLSRPARRPRRQA